MLSMMRYAVLCYAMLMSNPVMDGNADLFQSKKHVSIIFSREKNPQPKVGSNLMSHNHTTNI